MVYTHIYIYRYTPSFWVCFCLIFRWIIPSSNGLWSRSPWEHGHLEDLIFRQTQIDVLNRWIGHTWVKDWMMVTPIKNHQTLGLIVRLTILWCIQYHQTVCEPPSWIDPEERIHSPVFLGGSVLYWRDGIKHTGTKQYKSLHWFQGKFGLNRSKFHGWN